MCIFPRAEGTAQRNIEYVKNLNSLKRFYKESK